MDLTSPRVIKEIAERFGFAFSKGLGQNFLLDESVLDRIVEAAEIDTGVLEVGPGFGVLTKQLAMTGKKVVSVEIESEEPKVCKVSVPEAQLSLAIGNKGQNVRLAARLTGWKIDIKPLSAVSE